jgi:hypothetical protein
LLIVKTQEISLAYVRDNILFLSSRVHYFELASLRCVT